MAQAALATRGLDAALKDLDGSNTRAAKSTTDVDGSVQKVARTSQQADRSINQLTGRLRLMADAAVLLGPALAPIGAVAVPGIVAMSTGLVVATAAAGTAALAFVGVGDAVEAMNKYQLEPTAENLQEMRIEMEKMGPAGAEFVRFIDSLEPTLRDLQFTARDGMLPGVEEGITAMLTQLPTLRNIISDISIAMGDLAADAGSALGGGEFGAFFAYLDREAAPLLENFVRAMGNIGLSFANVMVAFGPLTRDFSGGLLEMTAGLERWTAGLQSNQGFQEFVAYIRRNTPEVLDLLGTLGTTFADLVTAIAPMGQAVLPMLTNMLELLGQIAGSPVGSVLFTLGAAFVAYNRAVSVGTTLTNTFTSGLERVANSGGRAASTMERIGKTAIGIAAVGMAVGAIADGVGRIDSANLERSMTALADGRVTDTTQKIIEDLEYLNSWDNSIDFGELVTGFGIFGDTTMDKMKDNIDQVDESLARMVETGDRVGAQRVYDQLVREAGAAGVSAEDVANAMDAYALAVENAGPPTAATKSEMLQLSAAERNAANEARNLTAAMAALSGWFDKRAALRAYRDGLDNLSKGLKDGFTREDIDNLDNVGQSILQVAQSIKSRELRADFLKNARDSLERVAGSAGPRASREISKVISRLEELDAQKPKPELDVDNKRAQRKVAEAGDWVRGFGNEHATARIDVDARQAQAAISQTTAGLNNIDRFIPVTIHVSRTGVDAGSGLEWGSGRGLADGGSVPKSGKPYADRYPYMLADGEEIISNRYGQADRHRDLLKAISANRLADGGTVGNVTANQRQTGRDARQLNLRGLRIEGRLQTEHGDAYLRGVIQDEISADRRFDRIRAGG